MKTIHIPPSLDKEEKPCVDIGDQLYLCFTDTGDFEPSSNGNTFSPYLPTGNVSKGLWGPYTAPDYELDVPWTFTSSPAGVESKGNIAVKLVGCCEDDDPLPCD